MCVWEVFYQSASQKKTILSLEKFKLPQTYHQPALDSSDKPTTTPSPAQDLAISPTSYNWYSILLDYRDYPASFY